MRARRAACLAALLLCLLAAAAPRPAACRALAQPLPALHARRLVTAPAARDAAAAGGDVPSTTKYDHGVFRVHLPPWLIVFLVLTALTLCCILSGICVAHHSQFFLVLLIIKGLFMALCCLKAFNWDEILKGKSGAQPGGAGGADPSVQPFVPTRANEHTPLAKVL